MGCDSCTPEPPFVEISPAENGFIITAYNKIADPKADTMGLFNKVLAGMDPDDPMGSIQKAMQSESVKDSVRRKEVEHHVAKNAEEALKILAEILGTMTPS